MSRRADDQLIVQFAECVELIRSGASVATCLERFPEHAAQLEPMLAWAAAVRQLQAVPARSPEVAAFSRAAFVDHAYRTHQAIVEARRAMPWWLKVFTIFQTQPYGAPSTRPVALFAILLILFISGIVISGSVTLAANALPGDFLYGVKTATEDVRLFFTPDGVNRSELRREFSQRRIDEALAVVERRRPVNNLRLQGTIESFNAQQWAVSGLQVMLDASSQVEGNPAVGSQVVGRVRAPGDGRLLLIWAEVFPPAAPLPTPAPTVAAATLRLVATSTLTPSPAPTPTATPEPRALILPDLTPFEPTDAPTAKPTWTATATPKPTRRLPTSTPTATQTRPPTVTPTNTLPPRPTPAPVRLIGYITAIDGNIWTIAGRQVEVTSDTEISGTPEVGSQVECEAWERSDGSLRARRITVLEPPEAPPVPVEFQDYVKAVGSPWWTIGGFQVKVTQDTNVSPGIMVDDRVAVRALQQNNGEIWAESITLVPGTEVEIQGDITAYSFSSITVDGQVIAITPATQIVGTAAVGRTAQVRALQSDNGSLTALVVVVQDPPEPTASPTEVPTASPTEVPTASPTEVPTASPTEVPTVVPSEGPTAEPTAIPTVEPPTTTPTETATSEPTATPTP